jgi:hypothetical protein
VRPPAYANQRLRMILAEIRNRLRCHQVDQPQRAVTGMPWNALLALMNEHEADDRICVRLVHRQLADGGGVYPQRKLSGC